MSKFEREEETWHQKAERRFSKLLVLISFFNLGVALLPFISSTDKIGFYLAGLNLGYFTCIMIIHLPKAMGWVD